MGPYAVRRPFPNLPRGGSECFGGESGQLSGLSLKKITKGIGKVATNVGKAVKKAAVQTGHVAGAVLDNKIVKGIVATGLAVTGVGAPAAAGIMAAQGAAGGALKKGGGLKKAVKGAAVGAATGAAAGIAGKLLPKVPGLSKPLTALRTKVGTIKPPSYDSDKRLDMIASGELPPVGITPTGAESATPVLRMKPIKPGPMSYAQNVARDTAVETAKKRGAEALRKSTIEADSLQRKAGATVKEANKSDKTPAQRKSLLEQAGGLLKKAATRKNIGAAAQMAATVLSEPSANPISPQGGYSPPSSDPDSIGTPPVAAAGFSVSPMMLAVGAGAVLLIASNRGK